MPWSQSEARTTAVTTAIGLGLLGWAWWQASGAANAQHSQTLDALKGIGMHDHATYTVIGVVAVIMIAIGNLSWVMAGRRAVQVRRAGLLDEIENAGLVERFENARSAHALATGSGPELVGRVAVAGSDRYHRTSCLLVRGKNLQRVDATGQPVDGFRACEMCEP